MPQALDVRAIVDQVKARINQVEDELARHERLSDELERLREALRRLEGAVRSQVGARRDGGRSVAGAAQRGRSSGAAGAAPKARRGGSRPAAKSDTRRQPAGAPRRTSAAARAPRGQNKTKVLGALTSEPMTASQVAAATGIATGTVSTLLTKLSKSGEVVKAERGYRLPEQSH